MELSKIQLKAIELAAIGTSWIDISAQLDRTVKTLYNWRKRPAFKEELNARRAEYLASCMQTARSDIQSLAPEAVECLRKAMKNGSVRAALAIAQGTGALVPAPITTVQKIRVNYSPCEFPDEPGDEGKAPE